MKLLNIHHTSIICLGYKKSKEFYINMLGLKPSREVYREERDFYKLGLEVRGTYQIEWFSFPKPAIRPSPEAAGLRNLALAVQDIEEAVAYLEQKTVSVEEIRVDPFIDKKFTFFADPDGLPIEIYEN